MALEKLHLAIIPDGNRRWAKRHGWKPWKGHEQSAETFRTLLEWARRSEEIAVFTFWCFSTENWKRSPEEVEKLMELLATSLREEREKLRKNGIRLIHSGRTDRLPRSLIEQMESMRDDIDGEPTMILHLAVDYGGMDEITRAVGKLPADTAVTEDVIRSHLDHPELPDIDLIIRTSGERRTSNFFLWQSAYAEWVFLEQLFPDVTPEDLTQTIADYRKRQRRFGA